MSEQKKNRDVADQAVVVEKLKKKSLTVSDRKMMILAVLAALSSGVLLISNLAATRLWNFFGIAVDGGIIIFPLTYILGDVVVEFFGRKISRAVIWTSLVVNVIALVTFWCLDFLPAFEESTEGMSLATIGLAPRIVAGSLCAFATSQLLNNLVFEKIRNKTGEKKLYARTLGSSLVARIFDSLIFETVAFLGVLEFNDFLWQIGFAYVAGMILETILTPLTYIVVNRLREITSPNQ